VLTTSKVPPEETPDIANLRLRTFKIEAKAGSR
jgi:hypothetical protein